MNSYMNIAQLFFAIGALLAAAMQIAASIILLRDRSVGPWMMLGGAIVAVLGVIGAYVALFFYTSFFGSSSASGGFEKVVEIQMAFSGLAMLGSLTFCAGLLLYALRRQAMAQRVTELETIVAARDAR